MKMKEMNKYKCLKESSACSIDVYVVFIIIANCLRNQSQKETITNTNFLPYSPVNRRHTRSLHLSAHPLSP